MLTRVRAEGEDMTAETVTDAHIEAEAANVAAQIAYIDAALAGLDAERARLEAEKSALLGVADELSAISTTSTQEVVG